MTQPTRDQPACADDACPDPARHGPGLTIHVQHVPGAPIVAMRAWLRGGARVEEIPGQALITGRLLTEGTQRRSWRRLAREAEERGMAIESFGGYEAIGISVDALSRDAHRALDDLAEQLLSPAMPIGRFRLLRRHALAELESQQDRPEVRTGRAFLAALYAPHPYSRPLQGSPSDLRKLTREDCRGFHQRALAMGVVVTVTGAIDERAMHDAVRDRLSHLDRPVSPLSRVEPPPAHPARRLEIDLPSGDQAHVFAGHLTVPLAHPDRPILDLLGVVLGAGTGVRGRMVDRIREREGLAYEVDVATASGAGIDPGRFTVYAATTPSQARRVEDAIRQELERLVTDGVSTDELAEARAYLIGSLPFRVETARDVANRLVETAFYGPTVLPEALAARWRGLTLEDLAAVTQEHLAADRMTVTVGAPAAD